jgi:hypothetical protein
LNGQWQHGVNTARPLYDSGIELSAA